MRLTLLRALAVLLCLSLLAACATAPQPDVHYVPQTQYRTPQVDPSLLTCKDEPEVPARGDDDNVLGAYIAKLRDAWADCFDNLELVGDALRAFEAAAKVAP